MRDSYRDNLERLDKAFPTKEMLNLCDVAEFTGISRHTVSKLYSFKRVQNKKKSTYYISKAVLAKELL